MEVPWRSMTFVVRVTEAAAGNLTGIVHRVKTGEKHRFRGSDTIGALIALMATTPEGSLLADPGSGCADPAGGAPPAGQGEASSTPILEGDVPC